jgi:hypothetical protein
MSPIIELSLELFKNCGTATVVSAGKKTKTIPEAKAVFE